MNFGNKLKQLKYENLKVFIRSDVPAVRAGIKLNGQPPLNNPRVFRQAEIIFLGLTNKAFKMNYFDTKKILYEILKKLVIQIKSEIF